MVVCSGQVEIDPATKKLADGIEAQTERALQNLAAVLQAACLSMADVVKLPGSRTRPLCPNCRRHSVVGGPDLH
jgi:hypothetical protein